MRKKPTDSTLHLHMTKASLLGVKVPEGKKFIEVFDDEVKQLGCRVSATGTRTFFVRKKVDGRPVKKTLGRYNPGPGGNTIEKFRTDARIELGKMEADPKAWLHGVELREADDITIEDAFGQALEGSKRKDLARRDWAVAKDKFLDWLKANHPRVKKWVDLRRQHFEDYKAARCGVSHNRQRLDLQPIKQVSRYMAHKYEIPDRAAGIALSSKTKTTPAPIYLLDVLGFLDFLKERKEWTLEAGVALGALAGLRMFEALRLRWDRIDLERGLVEVSGATKNTYSTRVIPVAARVVEALKRAFSVRLVLPVKNMDGGPVVASISGAPYDQGRDSWHNYAKLVRDQMRAYSKKFNADQEAAGSQHRIKLSWKVKDFRNVLPTLARIRKFESDILEQYLGHSPKTVTQRHYVPRLASGTLGEAKELELEMNTFRRLVVEPLEREILEEQAGMKKVMEIAPAKAAGNKKRAEGRA